MSELLAVERAYFMGNLESLAKQHPGRYLLIKGEKVYGAYETHALGVDAGIEVFGRGPFLVASLADPDPEPLTIPALMTGVPLADP